MNPSEFSKATADLLHLTNVARVDYLGAQVEVKQKPCSFKGCPYYAYLVDTDIRDGRRLSTYKCDEQHLTIVTEIC